jgi:hypothetical protein
MLHHLDGYGAPGLRPMHCCRRAREAKPGSRLGMIKYETSGEFSSLARSSVLSLIKDGWRWEERGEFVENDLPHEGSTRFRPLGFPPGAGTVPRQGLARVLAALQPGTTSRHRRERKVLHGLERAGWNLLRIPEAGGRGSPDAPAGAARGGAQIRISNAPDEPWFKYAMKHAQCKPEERGAAGSGGAVTLA